jgi:hypothetical protein
MALCFGGCVFGGGEGSEGLGVGRVSLQLPNETLEGMVVTNTQQVGMNGLQ